MKLFLDMDGVLVNFLGGLHAALGVDFDLDNYPHEKGKWNMLTDIGGFNLPFTTIDSVCTPDFWANLKWMPDGHDILREVMTYRHLHGVYLLTAPMPNLGSASGKMRWVAKHLPHFLDRTIITQAPKALLAGPDCILVDDKDQNIREWTEAGGIGVPVPRPWNKLHRVADQTCETVRDQLADIFRGDA